MITLWEKQKAILCTHKRTNTYTMTQRKNNRQYGKYFTSSYFCCIFVDYHFLFVFVFYKSSLASNLTVFCKMAHLFKERTAQLLLWRLIILTPLCPFKGKSGRKYFLGIGSICLYVFYVCLQYHNRFPIK